MKEKNQKAISGVLVSTDNKILMGKLRPLPKTAYEGTWVIPGGIQEEWEADEETLKREILEETGIDISENKGIELIVAGDEDDVVRTGKDGMKTLCHIEFFTYKILLSKGSDDYRISDTKELIDLKWFKPEELKNLKHNKPSKRLFKKMGIPGF